LEKSTYTGSDKTIETVISAGSCTTLAGGSDEKVEDEPVSLIQQMARIARRASLVPDPTANTVTVTKEIYIKEEHISDPPV
jgi:hypothetical protein